MTYNKTELVNKIKFVIKRYLGSANEDLEQEVYIRLWKNRDKYKEQNKLLSWVCTVTANLCKDYLKSKDFRQNQVTSGDEDLLKNQRVKDTPESILSAKQRQKFILKQIDSLPAKMKQSLVLYEFEDYSYEDIANKLHIPVGTVKSRINNARKILSDKLSVLIKEDNND